MEKYNIISNASGTRNMEITDEHLEVIMKHRLFSNLVGSNGIVDEELLSNLRLFVASLIDSTGAKDEQLVNFYKDVLTHPNMKATALGNLMELYANWKEQHDDTEEVSTQQTE